jgi:signal transduction histidine kinase
MKLDALAQQWIGNVLLLGAILFPLLGLLDYAVTPENFPRFIIIRLTVAALLGALFAVNRLKLGMRHQHAVIFAAAVLSAGAIEMMILSFGGPRSGYYAGISIVAICAVGFSPIGVGFSAALLGAVYAVYLIPLIEPGIAADATFIVNNAILLTTFVIILALRQKSQARILSELSLLDALEQNQRQIQRYAEEMREQNEEMKSFTYIVSHDLRAPLVNIRGFSRELQRSLRDLAPALEQCLSGARGDRPARYAGIITRDIPESLRFIESSVARMDGMISAILQLSRMGRREMKPELVDTQDLVQSLLPTLAHRAHERRARVTVGRLPVVVADRTAMEQIMANLLDNALKYLEPGRDGAVEVLSERNERETVFRVRDNGRGMAPEDIPRAFELFQRVGKPDQPGHGMGLAYVKALVRRHGGRIWCESEPGAGTTFSFAIPARPEEGKAEGGTVSR